MTGSTRLSFTCGGCNYSSPTYHTPEEVVEAIQAHAESHSPTVAADLGTALKNLADEFGFLHQQYEHSCQGAQYCRWWKDLLDARDVLDSLSARAGSGEPGSNRHAGTAPGVDAGTAPVALVPDAQRADNPDLTGGERNGRLVARGGPLAAGACEACVSVNQGRSGGRWEDAHHEYEARLRAENQHLDTVRFDLEAQVAALVADSARHRAEVAECRHYQGQLGPAIAAKETAGDLLLLVYRAFNVHPEARGVHPAIWHLYASELKPWLDENRPGWREAEDRAARELQGEPEHHDDDGDAERETRARHEAHEAGAHEAELHGSGPEGGP